MSSFLLFKLAKEKFAVKINKVLEVLLEYKIVEAPDSPKFIEGVINFRGDIVPIVNFREKFGFEEVQNAIKMLIIFEISQHEKKIIFGIIVNGVQDVIEIEKNKIQEVPEFGAKYNPQYIEGMIKIEPDFYMVMNIEKVFSDDRVKTISGSKKIKL